MLRRDVCLRDRIALKEAPSLVFTRTVKDRADSLMGLLSKSPSEAVRRDTAALLRRTAGLRVGMGILRGVRCRVSGGEEKERYLLSIQALRMK